jgi:REP element-mobilizing transposase RayT
MWKIIHERRATCEDRGDLLSMLLAAVDEAGDGGGMTDQRARDEALTLFLAGHDSTAAGLTWTWYLAARHPAVEARLADEIETTLAGRPPTWDDLPPKALHWSAGRSKKGERAMSQSLVQIYADIVFSTKDRQQFLEDAALRERTHGYLKGVCDNHGSPSLRIGDVADHVHVLCRLSKTLDVSTLVRELKRDSSKWVKEQDPRLSDHYWQQGYGAFSMSPSHVEPLKQYISNQEEHHRGETFQDEYRRLCKKYGVAIDERYSVGLMPWCNAFGVIRVGLGPSFQGAPLRGDPSLWNVTASR